MSLLAAFFKTQPRRRAAWTRFLGAREGAMAPIYAVSIIPVIMMLGAGIDYGTAENDKAKLDSALDAASLAAVSVSVSQPTTAQAQTTATNMFYGAISSLPNVTVTSLSVNVSDNAGVRTAVLKYTATMPTAVMKVVGRPTMTLQGSSTAAQNNPTYMNFYMLLDNTPSMGLAATPTDQTNLINATASRAHDPSCAFACHTTSGLDAAGLSDYYTVAKQIGVSTRIDLVRLATQQLMATAQSPTIQQVPNQFQMAIGTFGTTCQPAQQLTLLTGLTTPQNAASAAAGVDLMTIQYQNYLNDQCTDFNSALTQANAYIPSSGTGAGASSANPQNVLFMVTDGVNDSYNPSSCTINPTAPSSSTDPHDRCQEPINTSYCQAIKNKGIQIAVLYTTYLPVPNDSWYMTWINPFSSSISTNMKACASPGFYFEVNSSQSINTAMTALFTTVVRQARLTH